MKTIYVQLSGPLLMHHDGSRLANPLHPAYYQMKELTSIRKKTPEIHRQIAELEFRNGIYCDDDTVGPYIPLEALRASLIAGAKLSRGGREVGRAVQVMPVDADSPFVKGVPLSCDGPRTVDERWESEDYDQRMVTVSGSRTLRTRPTFDKWSCTVALSFDEARVKKDQLLTWFRDAGKYEGLLEGRAIGMGRFRIKELKEKEALKATKAAQA